MIWQSLCWCSCCSNNSDHSPLLCFPSDGSCCGSSWTGNKRTILYRAGCYRLRALPSIHQSYLPRACWTVGCWFDVDLDEGTKGTVAIATLPGRKWMCSEGGSSLHYSHKGQSGRPSGTSAFLCAANSLDMGRHEFHDIVLFFYA